MKFINPDNIIVFGGSQLVLEFLKVLKKKKLNFIILQIKGNLMIS